MSSNFDKIKNMQMNIQKNDLTGFKEKYVPYNNASK